MRGSNLAFFRADLERSTDLRRRFIGWGLEDSDIVIRMIRNGVQRKDGRFATGVLHLWHPEADRSQLAANRASSKSCSRAIACARCSGLSALAPDRGAVAVGQ